MEFNWHNRYKAMKSELGLTNSDMDKKIKDMTDEELKKLFKMSSRQVGSTIRSKMIIEELIKRTTKPKQR
jgi:hypothetical protein